MIQTQSIDGEVSRMETGRERTWRAEAEKARFWKRPNDWRAANMMASLWGVDRKTEGGPRGWQLDTGSVWGREDRG